MTGTFEKDEPYDIFMILFMKLIKYIINLVV